MKAKTNRAGVELTDISCIDKESVTQLKWDSLLMRAWTLERNIGWVCYKLCGDNLVDVYQLIDMLKEKGIKRSLTTAHGKDPVLRLKTPVRAFIDEYCPALSRKLWDDGLAESFIFNLDEYKWSCLGGKKKAMKKQSFKVKTYKAYNSTRQIKAREIDKRYSWQTVK